MQNPISVLLDFFFPDRLKYTPLCTTDPKFRAKAQAMMYGGIDADDPKNVYMFTEEDKIDIEELRVQTREDKRIKWEKLWPFKK